MELDALETELLNTASHQLAALAGAKSATDALATTLDGATVEPAGDDAPPSYFVRAAILGLAVIGLRTARAAILVIAAGYEPEAHGLKRRLSEVHQLTQAITGDESGQSARAWLEGKGSGKPRKIARKWGSLEVWDLYSASGHADVRGLHWWLSVPVEGRSEHRGLIVPPHRRPTFSNPMLVEVAMECRDLAAALAVARGGDLQGLSKLDEWIAQALESHYSPPPTT